ncbi:putative small nuclear ribonucleoprotein G [Diplonema papillatum]|nr:putative small nuclear ribonucleoprotein G [Diplonema papillatum]WGM49936.1 SmG [Diplonema papillatum]|eukprot:gene2156-3308_t
MSNRAVLPDLKKYVDKKLCIHLSDNKSVQGTLRGYDTYCNIVLDNTTEETNENIDLGMVVIRGNSVLNIQLLSE